MIHRSDQYNYTDCCYAEFGHHAECHSAECRSDVCHGTLANDKALEKLAKNILELTKLSSPAKLTCSINRSRGCTIKLLRPDFRNQLEC